MHKHGNMIRFLKKVSSFILVFILVFVRHPRHSYFTQDGSSMLQTTTHDICEAQLLSSWPLYSPFPRTTGNYGSLNLPSKHQEDSIHFTTGNLKFNVMHHDDSINSKLYEFTTGNLKHYSPIRSSSSHQHVGQHLRLSSRKSTNVLGLDDQISFQYLQWISWSREAVQHRGLITSDVADNFVLRYPPTFKGFS